MRHLIAEFDAGPKSASGEVISEFSPPTDQQSVVPFT